jgi:hypothetical protein
VTTPSFVAHENAIISPHVAAMPASATDVTKYRRRAIDTTGGNIDIALVVTPSARVHRSSRARART